MPINSAPVWAYSLPYTLALMVPIDLIASLAMDVYLPVVPLMPDALGTSPALVQLTLTAYMLVLGLGQLLFGPMSDRFGRRPIVLGGAAMFAVASFLLAATHEGGAFLGFRVLQALGASAALVGMFATVRDVYADRPEGTTIYGLFSSILAFVPAVGPLLGAIVALTLGWRAIFTSLGALAVLIFVHAWFRWPETRPTPFKPQDRTVVSILGNLSFWVYTTGFATAMGAFFVFFSIAPRVLINRASWGQLGFSLAFSSVALVMIFTTRHIGTFAKTWGVPGCFVRGVLVIAGGAIVLALLSAFTEAMFIAFILPMWMIAAGIVMVVGVTANGALRDFAQAAGTAVAWYYGIQSIIVSGLGTLLVMTLDGTTVRPLVVYCLVMACVSMAGYGALKNR
ncbi:CmlA/FloR family chloramphenicol efflux MFS transporter [Achromobacter animicus]|uniref:CmlA/FloR family chloramphenicol efflux MFS transporter n=1 Tax=Achromobacter animicus TaxID=1389935 RepID=UPI0028AB41F6|nr:CmlA/FloR family chloramphenicol efflux MFS transporter [Achromobacter animicus]